MNKEELLFPFEALGIRDMENRFGKIKEHLNGFRGFLTEHGVFLNADSREVVQRLPDGIFDLIITDPPYLPKVEKFMKDQASDYGDENTVFEMEDELYRVLKRDAWFVVYWSVKNLPKIFRFKRFNYVWMLIALFPSTYSKSRVGDRKFFPIFVFEKGRPLVVIRSVDVIHSEELPFIQEKVRLQDFKPTTVNARLVQMFMHKNEIVFDPFAGHGSLPLVAEVFKRKWVAVEIDNKRFELAREFFKRFLGVSPVDF